VQTAIVKNAFLCGGEGVLGMSLWNQGGGGPEKVWQPLVYKIYIFRS
jgi:hypothetical protein